MSTDVELPELGESVVEATIGVWLVKEGDAVEMDQPLVEVTTDKADAELPSPAAGVVEKILVSEGETVSVGTVVARIAEGESAAAGASSEGSKAEAKGDDGSRSRRESEDDDGSGSRRESKGDDGSRSRRESGDDDASRDDRRSEAGDRWRSRSEDDAGPPDDGGDGPRATPVARRMARERDVDLDSVQGTGDAGRVTKEDVARHGAAPEPRKPAPEPRKPAPEPRKPAPEPRQPAPAGRASRAPARGADDALPPYMTYALQEGDKVVPMSPLRRIVAEHMVLSKRTSPHVGTVAEIDMGAVAALRDAHKRAFREQQGYSLTYLPFIVAATVKALREFPALNASVVGDTIVEKRDVHVGVAVETEKGLVVPVVRHADRLSLTGLAAAIEDLSSRARNRKISPDDLRGGSFTISNPGRQGNLYGFAIINQPQVGILRMGEIVKRPVVRDADGSDAIVGRPMMHLALSYDHRAVDGAPANGFLYRIRELLEEAEFDL